MKAIKFIIGAVATMAGTQALLFWLGAVEQPLWFISCMALYTVGLYCFAGTRETEKSNK